MEASPDFRSRPRFPILHGIVRFARKALANWMERHRHPFNFAIHLIGIPMSVIGLGLFALALVTSVPWYYGAGLFILGYVLQYIGHQVEGNDLGEWAGIKRLLGLPYVAISPRWQREDDQVSR